MKNIELQYLQALEDIWLTGYTEKDERTGTGTIGLTNVFLEHSDVTALFPLFLSKKVQWKSLVGELLWFLEGSVSDARLAAITYGDPTHKTIWTANYEAQAWQDHLESRWPGQKDSFMPHECAYKEGDLSTNFKCAPPRYLGPIYGKQWREGFGTDQILNLIEGIKKNPAGRRHVVSAWDPSVIPNKVALPPCHMMFQCNVQGAYIDLAMFQRSGDMFLGVPFNIASYALLLHIIARETGLTARKLSIMIGNAHIYSNHVDQVKQQLDRPRNKIYDANQVAMFNRAEIRTDYQDRVPVLSINTASQLFDPFFRFGENIGYKVSDFTINNYEPLPGISAPMAV